MIRTQDDFEETAALLNPDLQSGLEQSRPASAASTPSKFSHGHGNDGSSAKSSRGSRLLASATPGLTRRKLFSYRQLSAWLLTQQPDCLHDDCRVGERQFWHPIMIPFVKVLRHDMSVWKSGLSGFSTKNHMIFFYDSGFILLLLNICSFLTFKYFPSTFPPLHYSVQHYKVWKRKISYNTKLCFCWERLSVIDKAESRSMWKLLSYLQVGIVYSISPVYKIPKGVAMASQAAAGSKQL